jgi:hypothetical protein
MSIGPSCLKMFKNKTKAQGFYSVVANRKSKLLHVQTQFKWLKFDCMRFPGVPHSPNASTPSFSG